ncbi:MAG: ABC transporter ATP-binding protein [Solirubrobacteraceae bacterium]
MSELGLNEVVKHYPGESEIVRAVDGVSLSVAPGQFVALYGPSGSGKTTLLMMAGGLLSPDAGTILFDGHDISRMSAKESAYYRRREVGFVLQSFELNLATSTENNAALALLADGRTLREAKQMAKPWLERVGLGKRLKHRAGQLSQGERQRVAIARALAGGPKLLLTDEPTGNLDTKRTREVLALLRDICHEQQVPGVIVTHDPLALEYVDDVHSLRDGQLTDGLDPELRTALSHG